MDIRTFKICYVASEVEPFAKTGGLADVAGSLPISLKEMDQDIRLMMPKYKFINERKFVLREVIRLREVNIKLNDILKTANGKTAFLPNSKVHVYFLSIPEYFDRKDLYVDPETKRDYPDNAERFAYFSKGVLETLKLLYWQPDIIHCNDWQTALIPFYLKHHYKDEPFFQNTRTVLTLHNVAFQGIFPLHVGEKIGIPEKFLKPGKEFEFHGQLNLLKGGIHFADVLNTVSEHYAEEICTDPQNGCGLEPFLSHRRKDLYGILNGVNYSEWSPDVDKLIPQKFDAKSLEKKIGNKKVLCQQNNLKFDPQIPLIGMISRLTEQKGMDLVVEAMDVLMKKNLQMVILGTGDSQYQKKLESLSKKYRNKLAVILRFDNKIAHLIEAGADMFLMPSRFEPCGLNQLYSLRYGTVPIVHEIGGLADTIKNFDPETGKGNGFSFRKFKVNDMLNAIQRALKAFQDKKTWNKIQKNGMRADFSWESSSKKYLKFYDKAVRKKQ